MTDFVNADLYFEGRLDGTNEKHPRGSYIGFHVLADKGEMQMHFKISVVLAESIVAVLAEELAK